jgi:glycosyltransferase involved in cell wall biosynthesis
MSDVRQILFVHTGPRPRVNERLPIELGMMHPGAEVVSFDVFAAFRRRYPLLAMTAIEAVVRHWGDLATRRMRPKRAVMETTLFARFAEREIAHAIRCRSVDLIVQSQGFFPPVKADVPLVVYTDHAALVNRTYPVAGQISPVNRIFVDRERALFSAADLVLVRSRNVKHCIERDYGCSPERVRVVGIGPNIPVDDHRAVGSEHGGRIVFVGVDWQRKGGSDLLRAFTSVRSRHPEAELHIVGCRPSGIEGPGLVVHGLLSPTDTLDVLLRSDIFCLPTWQEPFGVAFV